MILSVPGKTFLVGEYLALVGGPSILLATEPRFVLRASLVAGTSDEDLSDLKDSSAGSSFHAQSPAGKYLQRHSKDLSRFRFSFEDPHQGQGGLGASSAQWALLHAFRKEMKFIDPTQVDWSALLDEYRTCAWSGEGVAPSGADVVSQLSGGVALYDGREFKARHLQWDFPELSFTLIRTGEKLATHEHLKRPQAAPADTLRAGVTQAIQAFEMRDEAALIEAVRAYGVALAESGRVSVATQKILASLHGQRDWVLAAKGCGAMGADVILALHSRSKADAAKDWASAQGLQVCGGLDALATGLS